MTLEECYAALGGSYDEVLGRLRSEALVRKFVLRFPADGSYELLCRSLEAGDCREAFRAAHTIKGVCQNLGFTRLQNSSAALTEALRAGHMDEAAELLAPVAADYKAAVAAIQTFRDSGE